MAKVTRAALIGGLVMTAGLMVSATAMAVAGRQPERSSSSSDLSVEPEVAKVAAQLRLLLRDQMVACETKEKGLDARPTGTAPSADEVLASGQPLKVEGGPNCDVGLVDAKVLGFDEHADDLFPITAPGTKDIVGYWANGLGWLPVGLVRSGLFDLDLWRKAEAVVAANPDPGSVFGR